MNINEVRDKLRELRVATGLTQAAAAAELEWSTSKILRIENGHSLIKRSDLTAILNLYEVTDEALANAMANAAGAAWTARSKPQGRRGKPTPTPNAQRGVTRVIPIPPEHSNLLQAAGEYTRTVLLAVCEINERALLNDREGVIVAIGDLIRCAQQGRPLQRQLR